MTCLLAFPTKLTLQECSTVASLASISESASDIENNGSGEITLLDRQLHDHFQVKFVVKPSLTRLLVSFQANKTRPIYRWYKYKEAFSAALVELLCQKYGVTKAKS